MVELLCYSVQESFFSWSYLSSVCACWLTHFPLEIKKIAWNAENYNIVTSMLNRIQWGGWYFYRRFLNFALCFIILHWGENMVIVMGQLDHSSFPKALILSAPCRTNQLLKVKLWCFTVCLFIHLFIYFGSTNAQKLCMMLWTGSSIKPVFSPTLCIRDHCRWLRQVPWLLAIWYSHGLWVLEP